MKLPKLKPLHAPTIAMLIQEAKDKAVYASERFDEYDNVENMHEVDTWTAVIQWLEAKI